MADTVRTDAEILALLSDIAESDAAERTLRDMYVTLRARDAASDVGPAPFSFPVITDAPLQTAHQHEIVIEGQEVPYLARASAGLTFGVNGGPPVVEAVVTGGDRLLALLRSSPTASTVVLGSLKVGAVLADWSITTGNFWTPMTAWPELVGYAFVQEDLAEGSVTSWQGRGVRPKIANGLATKLPDNGGVLFTGTQSMSWGVDTEFGSRASLVGCDRACRCSWVRHGYPHPDRPYRQRRQRVSPARAAIRAGAAVLLDPRRCGRQASRGSGQHHRLQQVARPGRLSG